MNTKQKIIEIIEKNSLVFTNVDKLFLFISSATNLSVDKVKKEFYALVQNGDLFEIRKNKFIAIPSRGYVKGDFCGSTKGFGFVRVRGRENDIFISANKTKGALDGEKVIVKIISETSEGCDGEVVSIYSELKNIVGLVKNIAGNLFLDPDNRRIMNDFPIVKTGMKLKPNMKVLARVIRSDTGRVKCIVDEILGMNDDIKTLELSLIREHNLFENFPEVVVSAEKNVPKAVTAKQKKGRLDLTGETIFTIDGPDAKDLDDAVSIKKFSNFYEVGVHIADVGEYVKRDSVFDEEAYRRGTSVYFPTSVLPMLPKSLSNGICSLNQGVERLTLSCIMKVDFNGQVIGHKICESVIKSVARLTYDEVFDALNGKTNAKTRPLVKDFKMMRSLCDVLEHNQTKRGALNLEIPEVEFVFNAEGLATGIKRRDRNDAHRLIEDLMVLANQVVAKHFCDNKIPFVYRVHEAPTKEKLLSLCDFLSGIGVRYPKIPDGAVTSAYFQEILNMVQDENVQDIVNKMLLRSMQKAKYSNQNLGHFGLALVDYCHFTSPIRRYPDLTIHRIIKAYLHNELSSEAKDDLEDFTFDAAEQSSSCERNADVAERDVDDLWKAYLMKDRVGEKFEATISSVTNFGFFVALDNTAEGLVRLENMPDDTYIFLEKQLKLKGSGNVFSIGDRVNVELINVNLYSRELDFKIV